MADGPPEVIGLILRAGEAEIINVVLLGMGGSDSNDVAVNDVFVPASRTFKLVPDFEPGPHYQSLLYRFPSIGKAAVIGAPVMLAIGRGDKRAARPCQQKTPFGFVKPLWERAVVQVTLAKAEGILRSARLPLLRHRQHGVEADAGRRIVHA